MNKQKLQSIANKVSKSYCAPNPIITRTKMSENGYTGYEIRTELPSYHGGNRLIDIIEDTFKGVLVENCGGCVYFAYQDN